MKLFDLEEEAQKRIVTKDRKDAKSDDEKDTPIFDKTKFSDEWNSETTKKRLFVMEDIL